jgi:hypothetical protein
LLNQPRIVYETAEIRTKQPKTKIPHVIEKPAGQVIPPRSRVATNDLVHHGDIGGLEPVANLDEITQSEFIRDAFHSATDCFGNAFTIMRFGACPT